MCLTVVPYVTMWFKAAARCSRPIFNRKPGSD
jgi:hypothetical protein